MPISAIYIDAVLPVIAGMKTLSDFDVSNWFIGLPTTGATPYAGFYFGDPVTDITYDSYDQNNPAVINGAVNNTGGFITVNPSNYLDTRKKATLSVTICGVVKRNAAAGLNSHMIADYAGSGSTASGFSIGFDTTGRLFCVAQNTGQSAVYAYADFPSSIAAGSLFAFVATVNQGVVAIDIFNAATSTLVSATSTLPGTRVAGTNNVLMGRKVDNNVETSSKYIKSTLLMNGSLTSAEKISVSQFLLAMQ